jgi:cephalosporin hydroxylase
LLDLLTVLLPSAEEFDPPFSHPTPDRFSWTGGPFSHSDAMAYYSFVRHLRPRTIVEIGSGWSTLVADAALRANGSGRIVCVDRYPQPFLANISSVAAVIERPAQELTPVQFNEHLADGDFMFIDSTHTVKHGSDCLHLYLQVLPEIDKHILVPTIAGR